MSDFLNDSWASIDALDPWQKILVGIFASVLATIIVRYAIWSPLKWLVGRSEGEWDNDE